MTRIVRNERGIALAIAIFALVVVGALVTGAFFAGLQEQRLGENARRATQAFGVAETGLAEQMRLWDPTVANQLAVYPADSVTIGLTRTPERSGSYGGFVYRLSTNLYLIDVTGSDTATRTGRITDGGARQRLGLLARLKPLEIDIRASLTTQSDVDVRGTAAVNGANQDPLTWRANCIARGASNKPGVAGVRTNGTVATQGGGEVNGTPRAEQRDASINNATFTEYGDVTFDELASRATMRWRGGVLRTAPRASGSECDRADPLNWGDGRNPGAPCGGYFPIIYVDGDLTLNGDQGQGVLLVNGNLNVQGGYEFFGVAIVLGEFRTAGQGNAPAHFWGGVLARNAQLASQVIAGGATLNYSACAIETALQANSTVVPLRSRGWAQLF